MAQNCLRRATVPQCITDSQESEDTIELRRLSEASIAQVAQLQAEISLKNAKLADLERSAAQTSDLHQRFEASERLVALLQADISRKNAQLADFKGHSILDQPKQRLDERDKLLRVLQEGVKNLNQRLEMSNSLLKLANLQVQILQDDNQTAEVNLKAASSMLPDEDKSSFHLDRIPLNEYDDHKELLYNVFVSFDKDNDGFISLADIEDDFDGEARMLAELISKITAGPLKERRFSFEEFRAVAEELPISKGARVKWARSLGLDGLLASRLKQGNLEDQLSGIKSMDEHELSVAVRYFCEDVLATVKRSVLEGADSITMSAEKLEILKQQCAQQTLHLASLEDYDKGVSLGEQCLLGTLQDPNMFQGMLREHCIRSNAKKQFTFRNWPTCPQLEWEFVVPAQGGFPSPQKTSDKSKRSHDVDWGRDLRSLSALEEDPRAKKAGLLREEVIAIRLFTGAMNDRYNAVLRRFPLDVIESLEGNNYETTLFCLLAGMVKLMKAEELPQNRKLYRTLSGVSAEFWKDRGDGFRGGVDAGLMSPCISKEQAVDYAEMSKGIVLELEVGRLNMGCGLSWASQYPSEEEYLYPPLTCVEVCGDPTVERIHGRGFEVSSMYPAAAYVELFARIWPEFVKMTKLRSCWQYIILPARPQVNAKIGTSEELQQRLKSNHLVCFKIQEQENWYHFLEEVERINQSLNISESAIKAVLNEAILVECTSLLEAHEQKDYALYNSFGTYKAIVEEMLLAVSITDVRGTAAVLTLADLATFCM